MKKTIGAIAISTALLLQACGERPTPSSDTGSTDNAVVFGPNGEVINGGDPDLGAALEVALNVHAISDKNSIPTGGTDSAIITALVTDDNNRAKGEQEIEFASTGGVLQDIKGATDVNGEATAILALARDYRNQDIVVTVVSGGSTGSVQITATGTVVDIAGPGSLVLGDTAELTITLTAGNGEPIANETVEFSSSVGNTITPASGITDSEGRVVIEVESSAGSDTITASALEATAMAAHDIVVANDILSFSQPAAGDEIPVGTVETVQVFWESEGVPVANENLVFGITAGQIINSTIATTDSNGVATIQIVSSSAGPATISVAAEADGDPATQMEVEFIATTPAAVNLQASSTRVSTGDTSTITALVTDANGNPVKNMEVVFASNDLKGGQLNPASAISNSAGEAAVTFTAGSQATIFEEIAITSQVQGTAIADTVNLTVVERVLNVTIGSTDLIRVINGETQYSLPFVVQVADGGGAALEGATVEVSIRPTSYSKGNYIQVSVDNETSVEATNNGNNYSPDHWTTRPIEIFGPTKATTFTCAAEDLNGNRILDPGEDTNNNGSLDPQDPAVVAADSVNTPTLEGGSISTDATGSGFFAIIYPQSNARWATVEITARAKALGVEAEATFYSGLPVAADELNDTNTSPPNWSSPYGTILTPAGLPAPATTCYHEY